MAQADDQNDAEEELFRPREVLDGRHRIEKELGRGGIGVVREIRRRDGNGTPYVVMEFIEGKPLLNGLKARLLPAWRATGVGDQELPKRRGASPVIVRATTKPENASLPTGFALD